LLDIDHFKLINDEFGHIVGDKVLTDAAARLRCVLLPGTTLGRYGGEELLAVAPGVDLNDPSSFEALRHCIENLPFDSDRAHIQMTCSIGVAWLNFDQDSALDLVRRADAAMYLAKSIGRNRVILAATDELLVHPASNV